MGECDYDKDRTGQDRTGQDRTGQDRTIGIDIYKILCMFFVIMFHFSDHGVIILTPEEPLTWNWAALGVARIFGGICNCAFALTTGYFLCKKPFNVRRLFRLWLEVWFYSVSLGIVCYLIGTEPFNARSLITMIFPLIYNQYWYFSTYFVLVLLTPFINIMLKNLSQKQHFALCLVLFALFSVIPTFTQEGWMSGNLSSFIMCYCLAAYIRLYNAAVFPGGKYYLAAALLLIVLEIASIIILKHFSIHRMFYFVWGMEKTPVVLLSLTLFMWFKDLSVRSNRVISWLSSSLFGVYLFHIGRLNKWLFQGLFNNSKTYYSNLLIPQMFLAAILIFISAIFFDKIRMRFFERPLLRIFDGWEHKCEEWLKCLSE